MLCDMTRKQKPAPYPGTPEHSHPYVQSIRPNLLSREFRLERESSISNIVADLRPASRISFQVIPTSNVMRTSVMDKKLTNYAVMSLIVCGT
jgi:hypothetical protein